MKPLSTPATESSNDRGRLVGSGVQLMVYTESLSTTDASMVSTGPSAVLTTLASVVGSPGISMEKPAPSGA